MKKFIRYLLVAVLVALIQICGYEIWKISEQYDQEAQLKAELTRFRPEIPAPRNNRNDPGPVHDTPTEIINQSIIDMQNEINGDIIGWLTIPNTQIDYPVVIAADNDYYLRRNVHKKQAAAGSIFMDCRCSPDFTCFNSVIYGHSMKNDSMFGGLRLFADPVFFDSNVSGALFIKDNTFELKIFAYMVVTADDKIIYNPSADSADFFEYVKKNARKYRDPLATGNILTLSTCSYEYGGARTVLIAALS